MTKVDISLDDVFGPDEKYVDDLPDNEDGEFSPLPQGWYNLEVESAELHETKNTGSKGNKGYYIKLRFDVLGPTHAGRKLFANLNIKNDSEKAEQIGKGQLKTILKHNDVHERPSDPAALVGMTTQGHVKRVKSTYRGEERIQNDIKSYRDPREHKAEIKGKSNASRTSKPATKPSGYDDDEIPF